LPEIERTLPPYQQIARHYREQIASGALRDGDRLPSTRQLVKQWGVAHATAAKVFAELRREGLVHTIRGGAGGTVVLVQRPAEPAAEQPPVSLDACLAAARAGRITWLPSESNPVAAVAPAEVVRAGLAALGR
jgi:DNA-binding transcriptional regulator YhcF (GntR family)